MLDFSNCTPPNAKKEERRYQSLSSNNRAGVSPGSIMILIVVVVLLLLMAWFLLQPPSCSESSQVQLSGVLLGFEKNQTKWDIQLGNQTYIFNYFDKDYMERMVGFDVVITTCVKYSHYPPRTSYDLLTCYICEECD